MKSIHIRNIDPSLLAALKRLARSHHRSLQGELHAILEQAAHKAPSEHDDGDLLFVTTKTDSKSKWNRDEIYADEGR